MRAKLERIAAGQIEYERTSVTVSDSFLTLSCRPGEQADGSFTLSAQKPVKGILYSSSSRMTAEHSSFRGRNVRIFYTFDASGLCGGEEIEGEFCIITEAGEFLVPYTVHVEQDKAEQEESYSYFVTADPISPLPEKETETEETVIEVSDGAEGEDDSLSLEETKRLTEQILRGNRHAESGFARLKRAYHKYGSKEMLTGICSILIKNAKTDEESFFWYKRGVQMELKITNLFEYFMMAVPEEYEEPLPRNILLYFQMENTLNSQQKAFLYANVIRFQDADSDIYRQYREQMQAFMLDQLLLRRQSENLAVLYERFLVEELLTIDFAEALADIMFLRRIRCRDKRIQKVHVLYEPLKKRITVPLTGGQALIPVYTPGAVILLEDSQGNCYSSSVPYTLNRLMNEQRYAGRCRELLRYHQGLYLYLCDGMSRCHVLTAENVENYKRILKISGFTSRYREEVRQEILQFYYANHDLEELDREFFVTETEFMTLKDRAKYVEILILRGLYEEAWTMVKRCGYSVVRVKFLIRLAAWKIRGAGYEEDDFLLKLCLFIFRMHKYEESILEYLAGYYCGPAETMEAVWRAAREFELNVYDLEERLLAQMLFTGQMREAAFEIYQDYRSLGGDGLVSRAYLTWLSWEDFIREQPVPEGTLAYLEQAIAWEENLPDICSLAYLRGLSASRHLNEHQSIRAVQMTKELIHRKLRFAFMKPLLERLGKPWILEDKMFVEYRANPAHKVTIHYVTETMRDSSCNYVAERLYPVEPGLFVKEFTLFYGERLTWFITEMQEDGTEISTPDQSYVECRDDEFLTGTRYADIYEMARALEERDMQELGRQMQEYDRKNFLVETLFSLK